MTYDAQRAADFFDEYGEREWHRFEDVRMGAANFDVHAHYLRQFVRIELDLGAEPAAIDCGEHLLAVLRKP